MSAIQVRYRPKTIKGIYGNSSLKESLSIALNKEEKPTSFLFTGRSGCGKTTFGRVIANELAIDPINVHIYNSASTRGIDTIREMIQESKKVPLFGGSKRIYILEECHGITGTAAEALLDFLEHPPKDVFIVLTTTEPDALKVTIKRRCFQGEVKALLQAEMSKLIASILKREKSSLDEKIVGKIIDVSDGSAGQALKLLDMVVGVDPDKAMDLITNIFVNETQVIELCRVLININMKSVDKWKKCSDLLKTLTGEPEANRRVIMGYFNTVLLSKQYSEDTACIAAIAENFKENYFNSGKLGLTLSVFSSC
jgi:DNA polymerase-3 subunit gamma/tau